MSRPTTKRDLIEAANTQFSKLWQLIDSIPKTEQDAPFNFGDDVLKKQETHWKRDKNLRDILIHLYEWHQLLLNWIEANQNGKSRPFLPEPYNWKTYPQMNIGFWEKHQPTPYVQSQKMLKESHVSAVVLIETFSDKELFTKKHFSWTGTTTLGSYCISATASHYDWAIKKVKVCIRGATPL